MTASKLVRPLPGAYAYAPEVRIEIDNEDLSPATLADVLEVQVTLQEGELAGCSLTLTNWDAEKFTFKYSDDARLDVGKRIVIKMGYAGRLQPLFVGQIVTFAPSFPESGQPTLALTGTDRLVLLRDAKPASSTGRIYKKEKQDWKIARVVARRHGLDFEATREGPEHEEVNQGDQDDLAFLLDRARRINFDCYITVDPNTRRDVLHFIKPKDKYAGGTLEVFEFRWGESLISFAPKLTISRLFSKVTVRGWDPRTKKAFEHTALAKDLAKSGSDGRSGGEIIGASLGDKEERIVDMSIRTRREAQELAESVLAETAKQFLTGSGKVMGEPDLRVGSLVSLKGIGPRFEGEYEVCKVEHSFGSGGYLTSFDVKRQREGSAPK